MLRVMPTTTIAFAWPVFILTGRAATTRCAAQAPALALSLDQRWRHCGHTGYPPVGPTGRVPRLFYFIYFFVSAAGRTHALHARTYTIGPVVLLYGVRVQFCTHTFT